MLCLLLRDISERASTRYVHLSFYYKQLKAKWSVGGDNLLRGLTFIFLNPLIKVKDHNNVSENIGEMF